MNVRMHYLRLLHASSFRNSTVITPTHKAIGRSLAEWVLFRKYWDAADSIDMLADSIGVPREEVVTFMHDWVGDRFLAMRKRLRIYDAGELLLNDPEMPLAEAGRTVGFQDKSDFRKTFRQEKGMSPYSWRECQGSRMRYWISKIPGGDRSHCP